MITRIFILLGLVMSGMMGADMTVYIGTYTTPDVPSGIWKTQFNSETGKLSAPELVGETTNPTFIALSPNGRFLYAALEVKDGAVQAWAVEPDGKLRELNQQSAEGAGTCYVSVDPTGKFVFAASYSSGSFAVLPVEENGTLRPASAVEAYTGSGVAPRQVKSYGHAFDARGGFAYACDLGVDFIRSFQLDLTAGTLKPIDSTAATVPPVAGPRHLTIDAAGRFAYVINEWTPSVTVLSRDPESGQLTTLQTLSSLPEGTPTAGVSGAEVVIHPNGKWLYVSNRKFDTLTVYAIGADGKLTWVENGPSGVLNARSFALSPDGQWLIAAGQSDNRLQVFRVDLATGKLTATTESMEISKPVCVLFAKP